MQDGVDQTSTGYNYNLWFEFYPNPAAYLTGHIAAANDLLFTAVYETSSTSHDFQVLIEDLSASPEFIFDNYYSFTENSATHNSAEWITEFPSGSGTIPHFSGVTFTNGYWNNTLGVSENITSAYSLGTITLVWSGITNCIKVSNQSSNGLQTNWITNSSCPSH